MLVQQMQGKAWIQQRLPYQGTYHCPSWISSLLFEWQQKMMLISEDKLPSENFGTINQKIVGKNKLVIRQIP